MSEEMTLRQYTRRRPRAMYWRLKGANVAQNETEREVDAMKAELSDLRQIPARLHHTKSEGAGRNPKTTHVRGQRKP